MAVEGSMSKKNLTKNVTEKSKGLFNEFKQFIQRGNAFDLAVAVVIGNAFNAIVTSLVNDIMMPLIAAVLGEHDFSALSINLNGSAINYGSFLEKVIDFLVVALCIFVFIKLINNVLKKKEEPKEEVVEEDLPNMDLNSAIITMGKMCPTLPEWEEAKLEIEDKLRATAIDPDIDPASGRMLIGEIDALLCELRVYKVDQEAEVKAITEMVEYIRLSNAVGTNTEERKASGMKALMNHKVDPSSTETVNLVEYKLFYESKLAFFNEAIEILKDRKQLLITFQGMMKIESTF
jgi:large conductance mechanosensitive channel